MAEIDTKKRIAFDLDGTLTKKARYPEIWNITPKQLLELYEECEPDLEMVNLVNDYYDRGWVVYIFTSRSNLFQEQMKDWLKKSGIKYHYFIVDKPFYDLIIDDKSMTPEELKLWHKNL